MESKTAQFSNKGMYKDASISKSSNEFAYDNYNIRITQTGEESLLSVTNEREPSQKVINCKKTITNDLITIGGLYTKNNEKYLKLLARYAPLENVPMAINIHYGKVIGARINHLQLPESEIIDSKIYRAGYYPYGEGSNVYIWKLDVDGVSLFVLKDEGEQNIDLEDTDVLYRKLSEMEIAILRAAHPDDFDEYMQQNYRHEGTVVGKFDYYDEVTDYSFVQGPFIYQFGNKRYTSGASVPRDNYQQLSFSIETEFPASSKTVDEKNINTIIGTLPLPPDIPDFTEYGPPCIPDDVIIDNIDVNYTDSSQIFHYVDISRENDIITIDSTLAGQYIGHCVTSDYIILFTKYNDNDYIYRVTYDSLNDKYAAQRLFIGDLGFSIEHPIETLFYYESEDVQKVYWVDGEYQTRVINVKKDDYIDNDNYQFDFVPCIDKIPDVKIQKNFDATGSFHSGVIQYFITYYNKFGSETNIVWSSSLHYIAPQDRGGAADEFISCSFNIDIKNLDESFDYIRIYSAKRQSLEGQLEVAIVADLSIKKKTSVTVVDRGTNQVSVDDNLLYFIGGSNFKAGTLAQKDDTLFLGNIKLDEIKVDDKLKDYIKDNWINKNSTIKECNRISFVDKCFSEDKVNGFYTYRQQINMSSISFKGFKRGEIYRFGIQYKTKSGGWTQPIWIGDKKCNIYPKRLEKNSQIAVPTAQFTVDNSMTYYNLLKDYIAYRIVMAKTDVTTRSILAQGIVCPTMFNYDQRIHNKPYAISSYIMRPRGSNAEFRHFYPVDEIFGNNAALLPEDITEALSPLDAGEEYSIYCKAKIFNQKFTAPVFWSYRTELEFFLCKQPEGRPDLKEIIHKVDGCSAYWAYSYNALYKNKILPFLKSYNYEYFLTEDDNKEMHVGSSPITFNGWERTDNYIVDDIKRIYEKTLSIPDPSNDAFYQKYLALYNSGDSGKESISGTYNNEFYVDESIVTLNSPDLMYNYYQIDRSNLNFRIVGIAPITANKSDFEIRFDPNTRNTHSGASLTIPDGYDINNISKGAQTLIKDYLYFGKTLKNGTTISDADRYDVYMWHHSGSMCGFTYKDSDNVEHNIDVLEYKKFSTARFSICTEYFNFQNLRITSPQIFNADGVAMTKVDINAFDSIYYGNYSNAIVPIGEVDVPHKNMDEHDTVKTSEPTMIGYKSSPHAVFALLGKADEQESGLIKDKLYLLPKLSSDEQYDDYLKYSFIWNDLENKSPEDVISSGNIPQMSCFGIIKSLETGEALIDILENYINTNYTYYDINYKNCIMVSTSPATDAFPRIKEVYKVSIETSGGEVTIKYIKKIEDSDKYVYKIEETGDYRNVQKLKGSSIPPGPEDWIWYSINPSNGQLYDSVSYLSNEYKRLNTVNYSCSYPYLFIGELYREIPYNSLYGGFEENAIENISWIPISEDTALDQSVAKTEGDTYFQRWDCVKTMPQNLNDINQVVDITSVMLESHICLDGRYDRNRTLFDILNINENNFNLFNDVYSQSNDIFTYNILDDKYDLDTFENQILWSKQKLPTDDIDTWTNISQLSSLYLDGSFGPINKLINFNDTIVAFQDKAIAAIKFNNQVQVSTEQGLPIEVVNSNKVTGYNYISKVNGCVNKWSINISNSGLYFIDDFNKALFKFNKDGLTNISKTCGFSKWFNDNVSSEKWTLNSNAFRITSDGLNNDIYIIKKENNNNKCLCYNEDTQTFTSFYPYVDMISMFNINGKPTFFDRNLNIKQLFNSPSYYRDFHVEYKINPEPLEEKIFTNIEYIADTMSSNSLVTSPPFKTLNVYTEYQNGTVDLTRNKYPNSAYKFRIWRADIPRDTGNNKPLDRIHNPWINLKLIGNSEISGITTFHSLIVKYFK